MGKNILEVQNLVIDFKTKFGFKNIINNISFNLGNKCVLTASQYLYAYEYNAYA